MTLFVIPVEGEETVECPDKNVYGETSMSPTGDEQLSIESYVSHLTSPNGNMSRDAEINDVTTEMSSDDDDTSNNGQQPVTTAGELRNKIIISII